MTVSYREWDNELYSLFSEVDEYFIAHEIFSFHACYARGETPQQAYEAFDAWATGR